MSLLTSPARTSRSRFKRAALVLSAGLFATTLAIGGGPAASAVPALLSASTASANGQVTVTVSGFGAREPLTFNLDSTELHTDVADGTGAFTGPLDIPADATLGAHTISVVGTTSPTQSEPITVVAQPTVTPSTAKVTASTFTKTGVTVAFSGFAVGDTVHIGGGAAGSGGPIGTPVTVDASGVITLTVRASDFGLSAGLPGDYSVIAFNDAGNLTAESATITVVANPAPAAPAAPVKARASFTG